MDQANLLNSAVVGALLFFALAFAGLLACALTLVPQLSRTLHAYEKLADTLDTELGPTLQEVQKVVVGVGELKQIAGQRVSQVSTKVEDVTDSLGKAAQTAQKHSSVWGTGLWAGMRAYLQGKEHKSESDDGNREDLGKQAAQKKQITGPR